MRQRGFEKISKEQFDKDFSKFNVNYEDLQLPKRKTAKSGGYDIPSPIEFKLEPNREILIPTGFKAYMLDDEVLKIYPRSGLGFKYYIRLANTTGVGDSDFYKSKDGEGHYWIKIRNEGNKTLEVKVGDGLVQAMFHKYLLADGDDFTGEERIGGLGSTDIQ